MISETLALYGIAATATALGLPRVSRRLELSRAKHPSLRGHSRMARRLSRLLPFYEFDDEAFFSSDGAPAQVAAHRRAAFMSLAGFYQRRFARSVAMTEEALPAISDLRFTGRYRVPFQYSRLVREHLKSGSFLESSSGVSVTDLDGNVFYDLTGSYGTNVFGYDFYKDCIAQGSAQVAALGPVLGAYHPVVADNAQRLRRISGLDEVSFHMSGTEAVMQAVRLARYHTRRSHLVRFCGAYHGWWEDVQPGIGNPLPHQVGANERCELGLREGPALDEPLGDERNRSDDERDDRDELERVVLSAMLLDAREIATVTRIAPDRVFRTPRHQRADHPTHHCHASPRGIRGHRRHRLEGCL